MMRSVVVPLPPVHWGGLQAFAENLNPALRQAGWSWTVVVPEEAHEVYERLRAAGVTVIAEPLVRFRRSLKLTVRASMGLPANIRALANRPEVAEATIVQAVGAHHFHGPMLASKLRKPLVWQLHSNVVPRLLRRMIAPVIARRADAVMTNGRAVAKAFWGRERVAENHFVFYAPVDTAKFAPDPDARVAARHELGYDEGCVVVGTVGNRVWMKNHGFLVKVARELAPLYPKLRFLIMGAEFVPYTKEYAATVEQPAAELNRAWPDYIRFSKPGDRVAYWLQALDIFTLTSHAEGVPLALFEAMCAGKPVVSVNVGSIGEIIEEDRTGHLCSQGNLKQFVDCITKLFQDENQRTTMGWAGKKRIVEQFSMARVVEAHVDAYEAAVARFTRRNANV